jgi:hypothetical protein
MIKRKNLDGKFRYECLAMIWFNSRKYAKVLIDQWKQHYNTIRPHQVCIIKRLFSAFLDEKVVQQSEPSFLKENGPIKPDRST